MHISREEFPRAWLTVCHLPLHQLQRVIKKFNYSLIELINSLFESSLFRQTYGVSHDYNAEKLKCLFVYFNRSGNKIYNKLAAQFD
jgi:hypothetical protein